MSELVKYDSLHAQHSKIMANIGLADDKSGTALHIFRSTGNAMLEIEGADKDKVSSWGNQQKEVFYDNKYSLHNVPVQMLLGGWGSDYQKEFFLGRSVTVFCMWPQNTYISSIQQMIYLSGNCSIEPCDALLACALACITTRLRQQLVLTVDRITFVLQLF